MSEPTRPPPEVLGTTTRRFFLVGGALLVAFAAIVLGFAQCDKGPDAPERPDPVRTPGTGPPTPGR